MVINGYCFIHFLFNLAFLILLTFFLTTYPHSLTTTTTTTGSPQEPCKSNQQYVPEGYIDYLYIYYCSCKSYPILGYTLLFLWLLVLFYLLGNTASQYFCSSLEKLSRVLRLSPSIAGITLLSLGNGAPDVFSSLVSFAGSGAGEVGISSVLGGAFFVTTVVVGAMTLFISFTPSSSSIITIDKSSFLRDTGFFLLVLSSLVVMLLIGSINLWGSLCFFCLYVVYVFVVSTCHLCIKKQVVMGVPLLEGIKVEEQVCNETTSITTVEECHGYLKLVFQLIELPLFLPRRITIPDISEERWSKPFAVTSVFLSPLLLATLWSSQTGLAEIGSDNSMTVFLLGGLAGMVLGITALESTKSSGPPTKCLFPWLAGGFLMSVVWAYITARELVSLLVSIGVILGISPSILGLTVLAWGNSIGDLIANVAMAVNGGQDGAQVAISGCYAGPIFNTLVGLGLSLVFSSWRVYPSSFEIPKEKPLFETLVFLTAGILWAMVIVPSREMKLDRVLGVGLLAIYACFLCLRISEYLGIVQIEDFFHL
ncbi:putative sodium/calcium exchanger membrane region [Dioscorea sansibarensis]